MAKSKASSRNIDLSGMDRDELVQLEKDIQRAIKDHQKRRREEALVEMEKVAQKYGVSMRDLVQPGTGKSPRPAKFRHPEDRDLTWSGRGRQPTWFKEAIEAGTKPEDLRAA